MCSTWNLWLDMAWHGLTYPDHPYLQLLCLRHRCRRILTSTSCQRPTDGEYRTSSPVSWCFLMIWTKRCMDLYVLLYGVSSIKQFPWTIMVYWWDKQCSTCPFLSVRHVRLKASSHEFRQHGSQNGGFSLQITNCCGTIYPLVMTNIAMV